MRGWFGWIFAVFGGVVVCAGIVAAILLLSHGHVLAGILVALALLAIALVLLSVPERVTIDGDGIASWRLFRRRSITWDAAGEVGIGGDRRGGAERAKIYVSPRTLNDAERSDIPSVGREVVCFPYIGQTGPKTGAAAELKNALVRYYPNALPSGMLMRTDDDALVLSYVIRKKGENGKIEPVFGTVGQPEPEETQPEPEESQPEPEESQPE